MCHIFTSSFSFVDLNVGRMVYVLASCCTKFKQIHSVFFSRVVLRCAVKAVNTAGHTRLCSSSAYSIRPFYWVMGIPQVSQWNCFPPYSPVSLKSASLIETECVGKFFISFNIWEQNVTEFIRVMALFVVMLFYSGGVSD